MQRRPSGDGWWNQPRYPPPGFSSHPPPRPPGASSWMSRPPPPPFYRPPPPQSLTHSSPPFPPGNFSAPPPPLQFSGPPPPSHFSAAPPPQLFGNQPPQHGPNSESGGGRKRQMNDVWSDSNLLSTNERTFDRPQNRRGRGGRPQQNQGQRGGGGGGGGGRGGRGGRGGGGRSNHQFQQGRNVNNMPGNIDSGPNCGQSWGYGHPVNNVNKNGNNNNNARNNNNNAWNNHHHHHHQENNNKNNQKPGGKKKEKVNKRELPENNQFHCEVCDRGFKSEEKYQEHVSEHTECSVPGCRYVAAPKLVQLHYNTQHRTGVAKKIWSKDTPEDIKKWIADRKRNYPSKENLARKEKERAEKTARGELITNKQFGKIRGRGQGRGQGYRGRGGHRGNDRSHDDTEESQTESNRLTGADGPMNGSLTREEGANGKGSCSQEKAAMQPPAKKRKMGDDAAEGSRKEKGDSRDPLSALISSGDDSSSDGDSTTTVQNLGGGLSSLMASYDDPQKEDGELTVGAEGSSSHGQTSSINAPRHQDSNSQRGFKPPEEEPFTPPARHRETDPDWVRRNRRCQQQKYRKNTLLERLLADEIRHERNVLLQCVHYIVNNNFLGALDGKTDIVGK